MKKKKINSKKLKIVSILVLLFMVVGYASVNSIILDISGIAQSKETSGIFITEVAYHEDVNANLEKTHIISAYQTLLNSEVVLSDSDGNSSITYQITLYNSNDDDYFFKGTIFDDEFYSNSDIIFELDGLDIGTFIKAKNNLTFKITFHYKDNVVSSSNVLNSYLNFEFARNHFANYILATNPISEGCPEQYGNSNMYMVNSVETESKFCQAKDNYGDTYYFRGSADNNYVTFAGVTWRIMRVNGTGSVRLVYEGDIGNVDMASENLGYDNAYIGYIYGTPNQSSYKATHTNTTDSALKTKLDSWYISNILGKYDDYVDDMYFYNDRSTYKTIDYNSIVDNPVHYNVPNMSDYGEDTGLGYGGHITYYGPWLRLVENVENYYSSGVGSPISYPTFYCASSNDCYTSNANMFGTDVLDYPIASLTMDDAVFAGNGYKENNANPKGYLYTGTRFHLLSFPVYPYRVNDYKILICSFMGEHSLGDGWITCGSRGNFAIRPVLNLKGDLIITSGNGTKENPIELAIDTNQGEDTKPEPDPEPSDPIEEQLNSMTLQEKIGQMIILNGSTQGTTLSSNFASTISTVKPGGIIVMADNISSTSQLKKFIDDINSLSKIPLFWSIDQEGGRVQRISSANVGATDVPAMYYLGKTEDTGLSYNVGKVIGEELRVFGFNMDFAPVADIWSNPNNTVIGQRSFGTTHTLVSKMSLSLAQGLESTGVTAVYKHFPGHGDTATDSHYELPIINKSKAELLENEIIPFKNAIDNGAKVIMVGHLAVPAITGNSTTPASLSKEVINDFLKEELGFDGLVITDGLNMHALDGYSPEELYVTAINAGVDLLLGPKDPTEALVIIYEAVQKGLIDEETINNSVRKILELKSTIKTTTLDESYLGSREHKNIISQIPVS